MATLRRLGIGCLCLAVIVSLWPAGVKAQSPVVDEQELRAAFLFQFGRYVEWPADHKWSNSAFVICLLGDDPFGPTVDQAVAGKEIGGLRVVVKRIVGPSDSGECRVVFVGPSETDRLPVILRGLANTKALTVGEGLPFTERGGMIAFMREGRKVRFAVNLASTEAAGLKLSSQLLRLAASVAR